MTPLRFVAMLVLGFACAHTLLPSAQVDAELRTLLTGAVERSVARLTAPTACAEEPAAGFDVAPALGPLARALHGTGRGAEVAALANALCAAGAGVTRELAPWLGEQARSFEAANPEELLTGASAPAATAFRTAIEPELGERIGATLEGSLAEAGVRQAIEALRDAARSLPLERDVPVDPDAVLRERWPETFFSVLAEEEARLRADPADALARIASRRPPSTGGAALRGDR
ncbi:MAG: DUF4197 family protein [Myxococcota bacterium]